jgi:Putative transposase
MTPPLEASLPSYVPRDPSQTVLYRVVAAHLVERVIPWVPTRQWVVSVPVSLRYWMAASQELTVQVHTIIRTTIGQYYVNKAVTRGCERANIQPGSVTFIQRFGSAINLNLHFHGVVLDGVYLDRTAQGLKPRFLKGEPPSDADITAVVQKLSRRVIRMLRRLGYLEAGMDAAAAAG